MAFPIDVKGTPDVNYKKLHEGVLYASNKVTGASAIPRATASGTLNVATVIEPGKKMHLQGIQIFCDRPYLLGITVNKSSALNFNNTAATTFITLGEKSFQTILPFDEILYEGGFVSIAGTPLNTTNTDSVAYLSMRLVGRVTPTFAYDNAKYRICCLGDSKMLSTMDTGSYGERFYINQTINYLSAKGASVGLVDKTMPGSSSADGVKLIKSGALDEVAYDLLVVAFGTNNANSSASTANINQFKADLTEAIRHRNRHRPRASIIFCTPGATDKTSFVANIAGYRQAVLDLVNSSELAGSVNKVYYSEEHKAITAISTTVKSDRFIATEALNGQVHYSMLGHDDVFNNTFLPSVQQTDFYNNILKLS